MRTLPPPMYRCEVCGGHKSALDRECWKCAKWAKETFAKLALKLSAIYHNIAEMP